MQLVSKRRNSFTWNLHRTSWIRIARIHIFFSQFFPSTKEERRKVNTNRNFSQINIKKKMKKKIMSANKFIPWTNFFLFLMLKDTKESHLISQGLLHVRKMKIASHPLPPSSPTAWHQSKFNFSQVSLMCHVFQFKYRVPIGVVNLHRYWKC